MLTVLLTSPRTAPGLLSWQAWSALRAATRVLAGWGGHPQLPALLAAGVAAAVVDAPPDAAALGAFLSSAVRAAAGDVVWLAPPGSQPGAALLNALSVPSAVLDGAPELPGAHLLDLVSIMDTLRVCCPWDREQTHGSLLRYLLEEAYEAAETIEAGDLGALREEIGDVLLQTLFHARIASERPAADGGFTIDDVADTLAAKLIRRHPHVFGAVTATSAAEVSANWDEIKQSERAAKGAAAPSVLDGVPFGQPALSLAAQVQRRAARAGIDAGAGIDGTASAPRSALTAERLGTQLMSLVAQAVAAGLEPEVELRAAVRRFADRVRAQEAG